MNHVSISTRRVTTIASAAGLGLALLAVAPTADAASTQPGDFSSAVSPNPQVFTVDDCTVEVGIVYDMTPYPNYAHIGGVRVNCASRHSVIDARVALYYWTGSQWQQYGASNYGVRYDSYGSGYGLTGILRTARYCVGNLRAQAWRVGATVRTERTGATVFSAWHVDPSGGGC